MLPGYLYTGKDIKKMFKKGFFINLQLKIIIMHENKRGMYVYIYMQDDRNDMKSPALPKILS
jgi:hypothetical protein